MAGETGGTTGDAGSATGAGGTAAAAATGTQSAAAASTTGTETSTEWTAGLSEELRGYVANKGFKDPAAVVESYRGYEKLMGDKDRLVRLPENLDTPEGRAIFEKLGRPKDAKDYSVNVSDTAGGKELAEWFREIADKGNFTQKQLDTFVQNWNARSDAHVKAQEETMKQELQVQEANLKRDWGVAFDQNMNIAKAGATSLGLSKEDIDFLEERKGFEFTMKYLHKMGAATGEAGFVSGKTPGVGLMASDQAKSEIKRLSEDVGFVRRYTAGDAEARRTMDNLHKMAHPEMMSL